MSPFELVFAVYGMLLGLAIAGVLSGFSRTLKLKRGTKPIRVGWLTPLLGILVMLDLTNFWLIAWETRDQIAANYLTLVGVLTIVGIYYLAATLIFPDEPEDWPDFDDWYDKQKCLVIGGLLAANAGTWIGSIALQIAKPAPGAERAMTDSKLMVVWAGLGGLALLVALLKIRSRRWNRVLLVAVSTLLLVFGIVETFV